MADYLNAGEDELSTGRMQAAEEAMRGSSRTVTKTKANERRRVLRPSDRWASLGLNITPEDASSHRTPTASTKVGSCLSLHIRGPTQSHYS